MSHASDRERWRKKLQGPLPGEKAHRLMAPTFRGTSTFRDRPVPAAVLVLFYPGERGSRLVFIKRNAYNGPHSAQVSFPGGVMEPEDRSLEETAVRETCEELGICEQIEILGSLTPLHIPVSNYMVHPFVGWLEAAPSFDPDPAEVQYIIEADYSLLQDPLYRGSEKEFRHGETVDVPYFRVGQDKIWGATAMMLSEVIQLAAS